jgi:hypothetical protein
MRCAIMKSEAPKRSHRSRIPEELLPRLDEGNDVQRALRASFTPPMSLPDDLMALLDRLR